MPLPEDPKSLFVAMLSARVSALTPVREPTLDGDDESGGT